MSYNLVHPFRFMALAVAYVAVLLLATSTVKEHGYLTPWVLLWLVVCFVGGMLLDAIGGCFERKPVNIIDHGAVMDGVTDDLPAFHSALAEGAATGRAVYVPEGTTRVTGSIVLPPGACLIGEGGGKSLIKMQPEGACCPFHVEGGRCCDPDDCGPCCEDCPTCPTLKAHSAVGVD